MESTTSTPSGQAEQSTSPLDPHLRALLTWLRDQPGGCSVATIKRRASTALDFEPSFIEALVTSSRARGYLAAAGTGTRRGEFLVTLSPRGLTWLATGV